MPSVSKKANQLQLLKDCPRRQVQGCLENPQTVHVTISCHSRDLRLELVYLYETGEKVKSIEVFFG